jgi:hypothetical protein
MRADCAPPMLARHRSALLRAHFWVRERPSRCGESGRRRASARPSTGWRRRRGAWARDLRGVPAGDARRRLASRRGSDVADLRKAGGGCRRARSSQPCIACVEVDEPRGEARAPAAATDGRARPDGAGASERRSGSASRLARPPSKQRLASRSPCCRAGETGRAPRGARGFGSLAHVRPKRLPNTVPGRSLPTKKSVVLVAQGDSRPVRLEAGRSHG